MIPVFNEADNLTELYAQLTKALQGFRYELLFVDDGSVDESYEILANLHASDRRVKVMRLARNYGQHAALSAGIECAKGQVIVSLDADLQCDPKISPASRQIDEGHDVVSGWRCDRKDSLLRRLPSYIANKTIGMVTGVRLHDYGCPLKAITADIARELKYYGEMRAFSVPWSCRWEGCGQVPVNHRFRIAGKSGTLCRA